MKKLLFALLLLLPAAAVAQTSPAATYPTNLKGLALRTPFELELSEHLTREDFLEDNDPDGPKPWEEVIMWEFTDHITAPSHIEEDEMEDYPVGILGIYLRSIPGSEMQSAEDWAASFIPSHTGSASDVRERAEIECNGVPGVIIRQSLSDGDERIWFRLAVFEKDREQWILLSLYSDPRMSGRIDAMYDSISF